MLNMQFRDNITIIRTKDIKETANILIMLKEKLLFNNQLDMTKTINYVSSISLSKKQNITKDTVFIKQLSCIPGISDKIALDISRCYPSMKILINEYQAQSSIQHCEKLLTSINGIGNVISKKVYDFII